MTIELENSLELGVGWLQEFVRFDTSQPPGDVAAAAEWLRALLADRGIDSQVYASSPTKPNVVATIGEGDAAPLVLSHHMDVVAAEPAQWSFDPFGGELIDGHVCGRGTLDMKGFGILSVLCALALLESGRRFRRPLRLVATADEEIGGVEGARWLVEHHLEETSGEFFLTEGSFGRAGPRARYYPVVVAEKGVSTVRLATKGTPGHASYPGETANALVRLAAAVARIGELANEPTGTGYAWARRQLGGLPGEVLGLAPGESVDALSDDALSGLLGQLSGTKRSTRFMLQNTFTPTMFRAGIGQNVIPASAEAFVDCRTLPGIEPQEILVSMAEVVDGLGVELELVKASAGTESPEETELFAALRSAVDEADPGAYVLPFLTGGGTDAKHYRPHGVVCYGLIPFLLDDKESRGVHGLNERVSVENLELASRILLGVVSKMCLEEP